MSLQLFKLSVMSYYLVPSTINDLINYMNKITQLLFSMMSLQLFKLSVMSYSVMSYN